MSKKKIIWLIIIIAIIAGGYLLLRPKAPTTVYTTEVAKRDNLAQTVSETGTINAVDQIDLSFKVSGRITQLNADVGDRVAVGGFLARVDSGTLFWDLKKAEEDRKYQKETLDSMKKNDDQFNKDDRSAQRAKVRSAEDNIKSVLTEVGFTKLFSPVKSMVLKRNYDVGENVSANAVVFSLGDPNNLDIETNVPESDITKIKLGQKADVTFDALPADQIFEAAVTEIDPASTVIQDVVNYRVKLKLDKTDERIKPGMSANIDIKTAEKDDVLMIPIRAVQTEGGQKFVQVLTDEKNNITQRKNITIGLEGDEGMVEVASGLTGGEKVVTFTKTQ